MALKGETSDLDRLQFGGKPILPEQQSYSVQTPDGTVVSSVAGGLPKSQLQYFNDPYIVSVKYTALDSFMSAYIENFFTLHRGQKFIATLLIAGTELEEFVVQYLGSVKVSKTGFNGSVSVDLIVEPAIDRCFQQVIDGWGSCVGSDTCLVWDYANKAIKALP